MIVLGTVASGVGRFLGGKAANQLWQAAQSNVNLQRLLHRMPPQLNKTALRADFDVIYADAVATFQDTFQGEDKDFIISVLKDQHIKRASNEGLPICGFVCWYSSNGRHRLSETRD